MLTLPPLKKLVLLAGDIAVFLVALFLAPLIRTGQLTPEIFQLYAFAAPFLISLWVMGFIAFGLYDLRGAKNEPAFFERLARAIASNFAITIILFYFIPEFGFRPVVTLVIIFVMLALLSSAWRWLYNLRLAQRTRERILFLGITEEIIALAQFLTANPQLGFTPTAFMGTENGMELASRVTARNGMVFAPRENLKTIVKDQRINLIVIAHTLKQTTALAKALFGVVPLGVTISQFPRFYESVEGKVPISLINEAWFVENLIGQKRPRYEFAKRILDLLLVFLFGIILIVLLPVIALGILGSTPQDVWNYRIRRARAGDGLIFFRQKRVGRNGALFDFIKFRSQVLGAERFGDEKEMSAAQDPRCYPFGTLLRKTYLDELPQLWNVLKGEMSFVGPRPERLEFVNDLEKEIPFYRMRELVPPGITGWAQINMQNDASVSDAPEKMQYDLYFIKNRSILLDLTILLKTALEVLQRSGR